MKSILNYNNFLNEKYMEDPEYRIKKFFTELQKNINFWFTEGSFSQQETELYDVKISSSAGIEKTLTFDFIDTQYYYQVIFIITLQEVEEDVLDECHIKVKRYDIDTSELLREIGKDVPVKEIDEDKILELFGELDEKSDTILVDEQGKDDEEDMDSLPDDETDLEDTDVF